MPTIRQFNAKIMKRNESHCLPKKDCCCVTIKNLYLCISDIFPI